ncbi:MAG: DUF924 family protein [Bradyrhizobiaceae bacterium]|nr:DUF924 family protein [Bradyrhizobiaceae bacterium]
MASIASPADVIAFWRAAGKDRWFEANADFDVEVRERFLATHEAAVAGKLADWEASPESALALLLLLDQFPRNMFRGTPRAFATDAQAREVAQRALARGFDRQADPELRGFFYLPFMHSEELADQEICLRLYRELGDANGIKYAEIHHDAIRRFGRFPHRNKILGRESSDDEIAYLEDGGFRG